MGLESYLCHYTPTSAAAAFQRPKKIGIATGVHCPHNSIRSHDFCLQKARRRSAETFRETAEASALHQSSDAYGCATAALDVTASFSRYGVIQITPNRTSFRGYRTNWGYFAFTSFRNKAVVQKNVVHLSRPDQQ